MHYIGLIFILLIWVIAAVLIFKWRDKNLTTISKHATTSKKAALLFAFVLIGLSIPFYIWVYDWFRPHLQLGNDFRFIILLIVITQFTAAIVPDTVGWQRMTHRVAAYSMAVLYMPAAVLVILSPTISVTAKILSIALALYMLITFVMVAIIGEQKRHYIIFQTLYIISMQAIILIAAYVR
jgi:hypothetical protein